MAAKKFSPEHAKTVAEQLIGYCEGTIELSPKDMEAMSLALIIGAIPIMEVLIEMCGSEEAARGKIEFLKNSTMMGKPPSTTRN